MSRWSKVPRAIWQDPRFRELTGAAPCAQLLYLRLLTGPENTALPGLFPAWASGLAESMRWPLEGFREAFGELFAKRFAEADWDLGIVWLPKAIEINRPDNPNVIKGWRSTWDELPVCALKTKAFLRLRDVIATMGPTFSRAFAEGFGEPLAEPLAKGSSNQEREREQEQEQEQEQEVLALVRVEGSAVQAPKKPKPAPKHTPDEIAEKAKVVDAFIEVVTAKKGTKPKVEHRGDHAAAFALAKTYGADEACTIVRRALEDTFVLGSNCTLRYIAGKAESWRGTRPLAKAGPHAVQPVPATGSCWEETP